MEGRVIAQAVSRWLPTAAARVQTRVWPCGICGRQSGAVGRFPPSTSVSPVYLAKEEKEALGTRIKLNCSESIAEFYWRCITVTLVMRNADPRYVSVTIKRSCYEVVMDEIK
jgi:hypothetical protein